jgi:hypothetical protein
MPIQPVDSFRLASNFTSFLRQPPKMTEQTQNKVVMIHRDIDKVRKLIISLRQQIEICSTSADPNSYKLMEETIAQITNAAQMSGLDAIDGIWTDKTTFTPSSVAEMQSQIETLKLELKGKEVLSLAAINQP